MKNIKGCLMSTTDDWRTPSRLFNYFMSNGFIDCAPYQCKDNLLVQDYDHSKLYINPPFSKLSVWVDYAIKQAEFNNLVYLLMPSRTDTNYFHKLMNCNTLYKTIFFFKGRLHFNDSKNSAPFPTMLIRLTKKSHKGFALIPSYVLSLDEFLSNTLFIEP